MARRTAKAPVAPRRLPTQKRARATVEAILQATRELLTRDGYEATTTNRIAQRAGVNIASLYQYFPSKDALCARLLDIRIEELLDLLGDELGRRQPFSPSEVTRHVVRTLVKDHLAEKRMNDALLRNVPRLERMNPMLGARRQMAAKVGELLKQHWKPGRPNPRLAGFITVNTVFALVEAAVLMEPSLLHESAFVDEISDLVSRYLSSRLP